MSQLSKSRIAEACANIALVKYWGKRDTGLNLPAVGSISLTLNALKTTTKVTYKSELKKDSLIIDDKPASDLQTRRVANFLDIVREKAGSNSCFEIISENNFPTGAGLASSASAFAALSIAASSVCGLDLDLKNLSILSRQGSGSAARSIFGGIVEMHRGEDPGGLQDFAVQLEPEDYWDLRCVILITSEEEKIIGSTDAMKLSAQSSPYYETWVRTSVDDLHDMKTAISQKDFEKLGELAEYSALKMHALTLSSRPAIIYWNKTTLELIEEIRAIRKTGFPAYFTIDAGPQIKVITLADHSAKLMEQFSQFAGVKKCIESRLGPNAQLIKDGGGH